VSGCTCKKLRMLCPANKNNIKINKAKISSRMSTLRRRFGSMCLRMDNTMGKLPRGSMIRNSMVAAERISMFWPRRKK
ncbi:hypothetical protein D039_4930B, partial [Vibrio parahaemolyticus EKP-028]